MALLQASFMSKTLMRAVPMQVILPVDEFTPPGAPQKPAREDKPFKTLYLLHGIFGDCTDWVASTRIKRWAEDKGLAVVMPSGENSFYLDHPAPFNDYGEYVGRELVELTRKMFPLSREREDTFIGGLSMGGFGAIRNGLKYHETFGYIAAFSSAVHILEDIANTENRNVAYEEGCYGKLEDAVASDNNPRVVVSQIKARMEREGGIRFPKVFLACGTDDRLIGVNRAYRDFFIENGLDVTYFEEPGGHDWDFWDKYIAKALEWLPID